MKQDEQGYMEPGSLNLPPHLSPEERARAIGIIRDINQEMDKILEGKFIGQDESASVEECMQRLADDFNKDPERVRIFAELQTGLAIGKAVMIFDGMDEDGHSARFSFAISPAEEAGDGSEQPTDA